MVQEFMLENPLFLDINPVSCGAEKCKSGHAYGPARREYFLLHCVVSGQGVLYNSRGEHSIVPGNIFVIHPGETVLYKADDNNPWHYIWAGFESRLPLDLTLSADVLTLTHGVRIFQEMMNCQQHPRPEWYLCCKLFELLSLLEHPVPSSAGRIAEYAGRAQNYIHANYQRELRVDDLAARLGLDRSYFSAVFKQHTGSSPQKYIVSYRLNKAAALLREENLSPGDVAVLVGYNDIFNFSRMFHRYFGVSPNKYKNNAGRK